MPTGKKYMSKSNEKMIKKAFKDGMLTEKQMKSLPEALLVGIVKSKRSNGQSPKSKKK